MWKFHIGMNTLRTRSFMASMVKVSIPLSLSRDMAQDTGQYGSQVVVGNNVGLLSSLYRLVFKVVLQIYACF